MGFALMIFLFVNIFAGIYVYRLGRWLIPSGKYRTIYLVAYIFISFIFLGGRYISRQYPSFFLNDLMVLIGSYWLISIIYLFFGTLAADAVYILTRLIAGKKSTQINFRKYRRIQGIAVCIFAVIIVIYGSYNASHARITELTFESEKITAPMTIALVTDVHLGRIIGKDDARKMSRRINALHPDVILIGGDLFDESLYSVIRDNQGDYLMMLHAPLGVYAVTGNHEYIGGVDESVAYMKSHGIRVLRDEMVQVGQIYLAGREDIRVERMSAIKRKALNIITASYKSDKPLVVLDHQPVAVHESISKNTFLHLSGHTHHGQFWPLGFFLPYMFEFSKGYSKAADTNVYVSAGHGTWGPPVRINSTPEIVKINLVPKKK
jgi:uncharacterized protein